MYSDYTDEVATAKPRLDCVPVESNFPLYLAYTSGTTGSPKGLVRSTAGYLIALKNAMKEVYGLESGQTWLVMSDFLLHSMGCYGPLLARVTLVLYEGKSVGTPDASAVFRLLSQHAVTGMFITPRDVRAIIQEDRLSLLAKKYLPLDKLRCVFLGSEHCDQETMHWLRETFKCPILDHWWQTGNFWGYF
jgi:propionyl-CoA synthetase